MENTAEDMVEGNQQEREQEQEMVTTRGINEETAKDLKDSNPPTKETTMNEEAKGSSEERNGDDSADVEKAGEAEQQAELTTEGEEKDNSNDPEEDLKGATDSGDAEEPSNEETEALTVEEAIHLANEYFVDELWEEALDTYTAAFSLLRTGEEHLAFRIHSRRSAVLLQLLRYEDALNEATAATKIIEIEPEKRGEIQKIVKHLKPWETEVGLRRKGVAELELGKYQTAKETLLAAEKLAKLNQRDIGIYGELLAECEATLGEAASPARQLTESAKIKVPPASDSESSTKKAKSGSPAKSPAKSQSPSKTAAKTDGPSTPRSTSQKSTSKTTSSNGKKFPLSKIKESALSLVSTSSPKLKASDDDSPRRSLRTKLEPLAYWKNERAVYGAAKNQNVPVIKGYAKETPVKKRKRKGR
jgi:tetratricopeptide (TPR) repeat protein